MSLSSLGGLSGGSLPLPISGLSGLGSLSALSGGLGGGSASASASSSSASASASSDSGSAAAGLGGLSSLTGLLSGGLGGGSSPLSALSGGSGGGLGSLTDLLSGGLGGGSSASGEAGSGDISQLSGLLGGPLNSLAAASEAIPVLGGVINGALGRGREGAQLEDIVFNEAYGTPLEGLASALLGGNTQGDEVKLYHLASLPTEATRSIPVVGPLVADAVLGGMPNVMNLVGAYSGGLLSEDFLQNFVTTQGTLGTVANMLNEPLARLPGVGPILGGNVLNGVLDLVTIQTDQVPYVDDLVAGLLGGDDVSQANFPTLLGDSTGLGAMVGGSLSPLAGPVYEGVLAPISNLLNEVVIAGPIANGTIGKLF